MTNVAIVGTPRDDFGKGAARKLRAKGQVPAVIYGHESDVRHVSLPAHELDLALVKTKVVLEVSLDGETIIVAPRQVQRDPVRRIIEHLDLVLLSQSEVRERVAEARMMDLASEAAAEAGLESVAVVEAAQAAVARGIKPADAIDIAVEEVKAHMIAQAEAAAQAGAADAEADAAESAAASAASTAATEAAAADES
jgi:large subunit ribosomal protein L25